MTINYPLYAQRKALRDSDVSHIGVFIALIVALLVTVLVYGSGAGAVLFVTAGLVAKFLFDKHPSDIHREQFEKLSEELKVVSLALYARVERGTDRDGTEESEAFYEAYHRAVEAERGDDLGEFWESVRAAETKLRDWDRA